MLVVLVAGFVIPSGATGCTPGGPHVALPWISSAQPSSGNEQDLVITIESDGRLLIGNAIVRPEELQSTLREILQRTPERRFVVRADKRSPFRSMRNVIQAAQSLGIREI